MVKGFIVAGDGLEGYFSEVRGKLYDAPNLLMFLIEGEVKKQYGAAWFVRVEPRLIKIYWAAPFVALMGLFFQTWGFVLFEVIASLMALTVVFWNRYFYAFVVWLALRKRGLKGVFKFRGVVRNEPGDNIKVLGE